ncbi:hypothetical protein M422DRAFT_254198 [Sphaerobolus stellatus SS14]|uniref:Nephrocystin 3-like N-terminal domain-containing protein n=1 Tax=Sphaerobolus stellatus (strain SS14) TaxID=990650 RepID=A0A0C9VVM9_SPHS4|nr:hypothetical protein M422DRAFT_254198 [Sphaerobolus stellatus SS14]
MDIFGTIASVIDLATMIKGYIDDVKGGKEHRNRLRDGLTVLQSLLPLLESRLQPALEGTAAVSPKKIEELQTIFVIYRDILGEIEKKLTKTEKKGRKLLWPFDKGDIIEKIEKLEKLASWVHIAINIGIGEMIEQIHKDVYSVKGTMDTFTSQLADIISSQQELHGGMNKANQDIAYVKSSLDYHEREALANSLSSLDFGKVLADNLDAHTEGTGAGLIASPEMEGWMKGKLSLLWCRGSPGVGKTISLVIKALMEQNPVTPVLFIYCNHTSQLATRNYLGAVLKQLLIYPFVTEGTTKAIKAIHSRPQIPDQKELQIILTKELSQHSNVFLVLDAFDEIFNETVRHDLVKLCGELISGGQTHVMITSRPHISSIKAEAILEIVADSVDIRAFINSEIVKIPILDRKPWEFKNKIIEEVQQKSSGMQLHMFTINQKAKRGRPSDVTAALQGLHNNFDETYQDVLERIQQEDSESSDIFHCIISWILLSYRSLKIEELQSALQLMERKYELDSSDFLDQEYIIGLCQGLVIIGNESGIVSLIHETAYDFLKQYIGKSPFLSQGNLAAACLSFFDIIISDEEDLAQFSFTIYAQKGWWWHTSHTKEEEIINQCHQLLHSKKLDIIVHQLADQDYYWREFRECPIPIPLYVCARLGLNNVMKAILKQEESQDYAQYISSLDTEDINGRTTFSYAAEKCTEEVVELLVSTGKIDPDIKDNDGRTPFSYAAQLGQIAVVEFLFKSGKIDPERKDNHEWKD